MEVAEALEVIERVRDSLPREQADALWSAKNTLENEFSDPLSLASAFLYEVYMSGRMDGGSGVAMRVAEAMELLDDLNAAELRKEFLGGA